MRRSRLLLGLLPVAPFALLFDACGTQELHLGLAMTAPQGLLDQATSVTLSVIDAKQATCDAQTGQVSTVPSGSQTFPLATTGCSNGDPWCTTVHLDEDGSTKIFSVVAKDASQTLGNGCSTAVLNQNPLDVEIQILKYTVPRCCNDGKIEVGEQCDNGMLGSCVAGQAGVACNPADPSSGGVPDDAVCNCDCTAKEILLSHDDKTAPLLKNAPAGSKSDLALAFGPGGGANPEVLRSIYESDVMGSATGIDLHTSFLGGDLYPITNPTTLELQLAFPTPCGDVLNPNGPPLDQRYAAIATADTNTVVAVYQSNQNELGDNWDVFLSPQSPDGCVDTAKPCTMDAECQTACDMGNSVCLPAVQLNTVNGGATAPSVAAGPEGTVLVTWTRSDGVYGRLWSSSGVATPSGSEIMIAPGGSSSRVAGNVNGFTIVYEGAGPGDQDGIFARTVDPTGNVGDPVLVNVATDGVQDQPAIAMLGDGSTLVAWRSAGNIFFQRMNQKLQPGSTTDQTSPLNTTGATDGSPHAHPAVAGANGSFVVAWEKPSTIAGKTDIAARFVGETTGFGYNSVDGQNDEFPATDQTINNPGPGGTPKGDRHLPAVAMSSFVAIGWQDQDPSNAGIWVRRFPPPM